MQFFLLSFLVTPMVNYLGNPKRIWNRYRSTAGRELALLILVALVCFLNLKAEQNYFEHLKVTPHSSVEAIKKSFKSLAIHLHPDRNTSNTATTDYVTLSSMYKQLVNRRKRELYTRYGDIFRGKIDKLVDVGPMDVLYVVLMNSATAMIGMCFTVLVHGSSVINNGALLYEVFCFLLDVYLRFSPDATDFLCGVPILNRYTVFELIEFMRSCRVIFMYYSNIMSNDKSEFQLKSAVSLVRNNLAAIQVLDNHITTMNAMLTSKPTAEDSDIAWRGSPTVEKNYEEMWNAAIQKSVDKSKFTHEGVVAKFCNRREKRNILWLPRNRHFLRKLIKQAENALDRGGFPVFIFIITMAILWLIT